MKFIFIKIICIFPRFTTEITTNIMNMSTIDNKFFPRCGDEKSSYPVYKD